jgi:hypothetical protein
MAKMLNVEIETSGVDANEAKEWVNELANVYADMQIEEYLTMNEAFQANKINVR